MKEKTNQDELIQLPTQEENLLDCDLQKEVKKKKIKNTSDENHSQKNLLRNTSSPTESQQQQEKITTKRSKYYEREKEIKEILANPEQPRAKRIGQFFEE